MVLGKLFSSVIQSCLILCDPMNCMQHARPPCPSPTLGACSYSCTLSHWCHPTISPSVIPFSSCLQSFPASWSFPMNQKELELQLQHQSFQWYSGLISFRMDWLDLLAVQGTRKSLLLTPQFKSINTLALSFLYGPTLTSIQDYWKNHSFD